MDYADFKVEARRLLDIDLNSYKEQQMQRRILQWIARYNLQDYSGLIREISTRPQQKTKFYEYLTINTSHFYRDVNVFRYLEDNILPAIAKGNRPKLWSAGCSIGAEVYSLVMIMLEKKLSFSQILATDIDDAVLQKAKQGIYAANQLNSLAKHLLDRYFVLNQNQYVLSDKVKQHVVFSKHNLLKDSYERNFDLILCRNVFIYFTNEVQEELIRNFTHALKPKGYFVVGSAEQVMNPSLFGLSRVSYCIYQKD